VDSYLEDVILQAVDKTADDQARQEIQDIAKTINDLAYEVEDRSALQFLATLFIIQIGGHHVFLGIAQF
jgi:hypothetical protein